MEKKGSERFTVFERQDLRGYIFGAGQGFPSCPVSGFLEFALVFELLGS